MAQWNLALSAWNFQVFGTRSNSEPHNSEDGRQRIWDDGDGDCIDYTTLRLFVCRAVMKLADLPQIWCRRTVPGWQMNVGWSTWPVTDTAVSEWRSSTPSKSPSYASCRIRSTTDLIPDTSSLSFTGLFALPATHTGVATWVFRPPEVTDYKARLTRQTNWPDEQNPHEQVQLRTSTWIGAGKNEVLKKSFFRFLDF